ncbi:uncharacterized protein LOC131666740 [Phymastichus coffea]|uniref:uncharacterized protein LOC131666740 n=1 Tax=Phymastichus coffea TaxID=108790 RepID=UPI00273AE5D4|nr:uncharacterized protein LOC131666740 [Phymastichus coffea]XP_058795602.1 uncharacterized protein LOC131666740 [Phymastichus coffea]
MYVEQNLHGELCVKRRIVDVSSLIAFIVLMILYIGVALYAVQNGHIANSFTYIHNMIDDGVIVDSTEKVAIEIFDDLYRTRFVILSITILAVLWSISTIFIIRKATSFAICTGIMGEAVLLIALFVVTIFASQSQVYRHSSSKPYLFFPIFIVIVVSKLLALKEVGFAFVSNLLRESCRAITSYALGFIVMFFIHTLALSSVIFGFYIYCQLMSTSLKPLYKEVQTADGVSHDICNFVIVTIPSYIYLFHMINIVSCIWLNYTFWNFGYVFFSRTFARLYQNPEDKCNSISAILGVFRSTVRNHMGTIIYASSPYAPIVQISVMWKYAWNATNEYLRQKPFIGSISWLVTVWNLSSTGLIFCSFHRTAFKQSAKLTGRIFIRNPVQLLTVYSVIGWLAFFVITFVTLLSLIVLWIYTSIISETPHTCIAAIVIIFGAIAMTRAVCQLLEIAILSIYLFMIENIEQISNMENKKPRNPAIDKIITQCHD